ncbi:hypothetical protein hmeg3_02240 [Herbaspirillum sp. meg3]|nr:hypothetical protein hmeg3_02240 [Herbaspirillum sp. meg3]
MSVIWRIVGMNFKEAIRTQRLLSHYRFVMKLMASKFFLEHGGTSRDISAAISLPATSRDLYAQSEVGNFEFA